LILDKIISQGKLELNDEELEKSFEEMALGMNAPVDAVKKYFNADPKQLEYYKQTQLEKKAVDLIIEKASITQVEPGAAKEPDVLKEPDALKDEDVIKEEKE